MADIYNGGSPKYPTALFEALAPEGWWRVGEEFNAVDLIVGSDNDVVEVGFGGGPGGSGDTTPPVVTLVSPLSGVLAQSAELVLRITDVIGLQRAAVFVTSAGGTTEMIYEGVGSSMRVGYTGERLDIADGFELTLRRNGGWFPPLTFEVLALDDSGNVTPP